MFLDKLYQVGENDKSYPDIHSLLILSEVFNVTLDDLVKEMLLVIDVNKKLTRAIRVTDETGQLVIMKGNKP